MIDAGRVDIAAERRRDRWTPWLARWVVGACAIAVVACMGDDRSATRSSRFEQPELAALAGGMVSDSINEAFRSYGDTGGRWNGGDGTASVQLPDGRIVWLFSDTFIGPINPDGSRPDFQTMIHNSIVVQDHGVLTQTLTGGTADEPRSLVGAATDADAGEAGHWVADGTVEGTTLEVLYNRYQRTGHQALDLKLVATALATFDLPGLTLRSVTQLPLGDRIAWGSAILRDGDTTYIYGASLTNDGSPIKSVHLARVGAQGLAGAWQFWDGAGWSTRESDAARLIGGVTTAFGVQKIDGQYVMVTVDGNLNFNSEIVAYTASSPTGPFTGPISLLRAPEPQPGKAIIVYDARLHPELAPAGKLLISYNVNSLDDADNRTDARLYRPRFVEVDWPRPAPDPTTLPPAPSGLTATADDQRVIRLSWTAVPGATGYQIHQRDIAIGQSHPVRLPQMVTATSLDLPSLAAGHLYEYSVTALDDSGESAHSNLVTATARSRAPESGSFHVAPAGTAITGEYLVDLRDDAAAGEYGTAEIAARLVARYGGTVGQIYAAVLGGFSVVGMTDAQARALATDPAVEAVEENYAGDADQDGGATDPGGVQTDPPWGLDRIDGVPDQRYVYPSTGRGVNVYVIDTGIRTTHTDFGGRAEFAASALPNPGDMACKEHGTHVAGTAGGGEFGVAKQTRLFDVQISCSGIRPSVRNVIWGINWVARNRALPAVANMSVSTDVPAGEDPRTTELGKAVLDAIGKRVTVVASAGNENRNACERLPAAIDEVITVAATDMGDHRLVAENDKGDVMDSNWGPCVDLFAPGGDIYSAGIADDEATKLESGTSMAAPHVSGAAALILATHPSWDPQDVADALRAMAERDVVTDAGDGSPNLLLRVAAPIDGAPTQLTATPADDGTIQLVWDPVPLDGAYYLISQRDATAGQAFFRLDTPVRSGTTAVARDLIAGHTYEFTVAAAHAMAVGPESNVASARSYIAPPSAPRNLTATANGNGTIALGWTEPQPDVWYLVYQRDVTLGETEFTKLPYPVTECCSMVAGYLSHGHIYEFKVSATNAGGEGPASDPASAEARFDAPSAPTNLQAAPGDGQAVLTWDPPPGDGLWYLVYQRDATQNEAWQQLPLPITECCTMPAGYLVNGHDYEFQVTATNGAESSPSNVARARPMPPLPRAPTNLQAQPVETGEIRLAWDAPGPDLYYWVYWRDVTAGETTFRKSEIPTAQQTATWGYLTDQHVYEFKVSGANLAGEGPASTPVQARSSLALPGAPQYLRAVATGDLEIELTWDAPAPNVLYWVYWRDVTAGETAFRRSTYPTDQTTVTWQWLTNNHTYEFKVTANNAAGEGPASAPARATAVGTVPQPPTNLRATPGDMAVRLDWSASPTTGVGYVVYYRDTTKGQSWQRLPYPVDACCTWTLDLLTNGDTYEFRVTAGNGVGESKPTNVVSARPMPPLPRPPSDLQATAGDGKVSLHWSASPTPRVYYWIEYRKSGGSWIRLAYPLDSCCSFTVNLLANGTTYDFRVRATNVAGDSDPSNVDSARPLPPFPQPPSNLSASPGDGQVRITWSASSTPNVWYLVEYRKAGGSWSRLPYPLATCCSFTVNYLANGTTYEFRVRATNLAGDSAASNTDSARPMPPFPQPPRNLRATPGDGQVTLRWTASPTSGVLYNVYQRDASLNSWWEKLPYPVSGTTVTARFLGNGHTYDFKVTAVNLAGESERSNIVSVMPRWSDMATPPVEVSSSWILNDYKDIDPIPRSDITGWVQGSRSGDYIVLDGGWHMNNGQQLVNGIFWFTIIDCAEGYAVAYRTLGYEHGSSVGSGSLNFSYPMNPQRMYKVRVTGSGEITFSGLINGRFALYPPEGIHPFAAETRCF